MSNDLTKGEVSAVAQKAGCAWLHGPLAQRFATLCRAPLVAENAALKQAHEINADTLNAMQVEIDDWKARALKSEQAEVRLWDSQWVNVVNHDNCYAGWSKEDAINHAVKMTEQLIASNVAQNKLPPVATPPQPAAQEPFAWARPDAVDASQDFRFIKIDDFTVPLYATPPSAVPVVGQLVEALSRNRIMAADSDGNYTREVTPRVITAAIAAGQQYLKENGK